MFRLIYQNPAETFDPPRIAFLPDWEMASLIYEGLVGYGDDAAGLRPVLAERWQELDGGRRWIFHLRGDVFFHDDPCFPGGRGRRFTAQDVIYTFERLANPKTDSPNWYLLAGKVEGIDAFHAGRAFSIQGIRMLDDGRVEFRLTKTYASFLKSLATQIGMIAPREAVEYYGSEFGNHPVGTGPFRLARRKALEQYSFVPPLAILAAGLAGREAPLSGRRRDLDPAGRERGRASGQPAQRGRSPVHGP